MSYIKNIKSGNIEFKNRSLIFGPGIYPEELEIVSKRGKGPINKRYLFGNIIQGIFKEWEVIFPEMIVLGKESSNISAIIRKHLIINTKAVEMILARDSNNIINFLDTNSAIMELGIYTDKELVDKHFILTPKKGKVSAQKKRFQIDPITEFIKLTVRQKNIIRYNARTYNNSYNAGYDSFIKSSDLGSFISRYVKSPEIKQFYGYASNNEMKIVASTVVKRTNKNKPFKFGKMISSGRYTNTRRINLTYKGLYYLTTLFFQSPRIMPKTSSDLDDLHKDFRDFVLFSKMGFRNVDLANSRTYFDNLESDWKTAFYMALCEMEFFGDVSVKADVIAANKIIGRVLIPKKTKGFRDTYTYNFPFGKQMRMKDTKTLEFLEKKFKFPVSATSYIKGKSISESIGPHLNSKYFYKTDLKDFFGSLLHTELMKNLESFDEPRKMLENTLMPLKSKGVMQGRILSPILSNIYMIDLDKRMESIDSLKYTRYADDILLSALNEDDLKEGVEKLRQYLRSIGLKENKKKMSVWNCEDDLPPLKYLGVMFSKGEPINVRFSNRKRKHITRLMVEVEKRGSSRALERVVGHFTFAAMINKTNGFSWAKYRIDKVDYTLEEFLKRHKVKSKYLKY